jgi:hypothetical protein
MKARLATRDWQLAASDRRWTTVIPRIIAAARGALIVYQWAVARPLWLDEEMIAINIRDRGFASLAGKLWLDQSAPIGWLVVERLMLLIFGSGERSLRALPMLLGLATIATALWIGRRWLGALATSLLVVTCAVGQWISYAFVELKHYSADACFGLMLPALAVWAVETDRVLAWWVVAAVAQLFGNGALFVTPLCAIVMVSAVWRRRGVAAAVRATLPGALWGAVFVANYVLVLRPAQTSEFLQSYWQLQFPPTANGVSASLQWLGTRLAPFAVKPGGTRVGLLLWIAAAAGFALAPARARLLALMFATVPFAGLLLTTLHLVPFFERLVLWIVPALYAGVAMLADAHVRLKPDTTYGGMTGVVSGFSRTIAILVALLCAADITYVGLDDLSARPAATNHLLDDRAAARWLAAREQPGDVWVTTHLALPALWWYAPEVRLRPDTVSGFSRTIIEVGYADTGPDCQPDEFVRALGSSTRVLVFTGFHFDDVPRSFDALLLERLMGVGQMTAYRGFDDLSRAAIIDRRLTSRRELGEQVPGCLTARPARRW